LLVTAAAFYLKSHESLAWIALIAVLIELFALNAPFNALVDGRYYRPRLPIVEALKSREPREPFRIAGLDWMFLPNEAALYGLEDVRGSDPMALAAYTSYLKRVAVDDPSIDVDRVVNVEDPALDFLNVRFLLAEPGASVGGRWRKIYAGADGELYENRAIRPRFSSGGAEVEILTSSPERIELQVEAPGVAEIISSQPFAPGWTVHRPEAVPSRLFERAFLGFAIPKGRHILEARYRPLSFYGSVDLAAFTAGILALWTCYAGSASRRRSLE
jgi:hypothetical protein